MKKISERHKRVVDCYLSNGLNKTQALIDAGYSEKYANNNIHSVFGRPEVKAHIDKLKAKQAKKHSIDRDWIVNEYMQIIESSKTEGHDGAGNLKDRTSWNKSLAQLAKLLGLDAPEKTEVEHKGITIKIEKPKE